MISARFLCALGLSTLCLLNPASAQDSKRERLGWGQLFTNDYLGDGQDRWRTASYQIGEVRGYGWNGVRPNGFGELIELRFGSQIIAPDNLTQTDPTDRPYAGLIALGLHTYFNKAGIDYNVGMDVYVSGPQSQMGGFQKEAHNILGAPIPNVLDEQIGDAVYPTLVLEAGRKFKINPSVTLRPFAEAQAGLETFARVGADVVIGQLGHDSLLIRDATTGHLLRATKTDARGFGFLVGGDITMVEDSNLLPSGTVELEPTRQRVRAGVQWQGERAGLFYGATWLSEEFEGQKSDQVTGSIRLQLNF